MDHPILLTKEELLTPINQTLERIEAIRVRKMHNEDELILEGLFVLTVASFEQSLLETLKILFTRIPHKLDFKTEIIEKNEIIGGTAIEYTIEKKVNSLGYKNLNEILDFFVSNTGIDPIVINLNDQEELLEIKARRNLLLHNNLIINFIYKETAGNKQSTEPIGRRLKINQDYLFDSIMTIRIILEAFKQALNSKYSDYTRIKAMKSLFDYTFKTPLLKFEDEFYLDLEDDEVGGMKFDERKYESLASSEQLFYSIWANHTTGRNLKVVSGAILHLSSDNRKKLKFLIDSIEIFKF